LVYGTICMESQQEKIRSKRPAPRGTSAYPRKRAVTACQVCRSRRTKCDNLKPSCSFCLKTGARCIQSTVDLSSFDPASLQILSRLDDLEALFIRSSPKAKDGQDNITVRSEDLSDGVNGRPASVLPLPVTDILQWPNFAEVLTEECSMPNATCDIATPDNWAGDSHALEAHSDLFPSQIMLERFWENVHVKNPILDEVQVNDLVSQIMRHGFDWSGDSCLVLLMCALGLITRAFRAEDSVSPGSSCYLEATSYFRAAQQRIGIMMMRGGLRAAQCLFFSGVFSATIFDKWTAWRYFSQSLACCQQFISPAKQATLGPGDLTSDKQAVYWSAWKSELEIRSFVNAADFPLPDHLTYPSFFPSPPEPTDTAQSHLDSRIVTRQNVGWFFYLSEISMRRLSTRISQDLLSLHASPAGDTSSVVSRRIRDWEKEIEQWVGSLDERVSLSGNPEDDDICKWILRGQLLNLYEQIYWPPLYHIICGPQYQSSPNHLEDLFEFGNKAIAIHDQRLRINRPGMLHRHHGTMFMIDTCTRSALLLLYVASLEPEVGTDERTRLHLPDMWSEGVKSIHDMLAYWVAEFPDIRSWAQAMQAGLDHWVSRRF
jgi:hypothetical protein